MLRESLDVDLGQDRRAPDSVIAGAPRRLCVFCGGREQGGAQFYAGARELGALAATAGWEIVCGGSALGPVGALVSGARSAGGIVTGIVPRFQLESEPPFHDLTRLEVVEDVATRKRRMLENSDAVAILPGGSGTLDEFFEALTLKRLGRIAHPLILVNSDDFFRPLLEQLRHAASHELMDDAQFSLFQVVEGPMQAVTILDDAELVGTLQPA